VAFGEGGAAADGFRLGERVVPEWRVTCGVCVYCRRGTFNYCLNLGRIRGGFAEYGVAPRRALRTIPDHVSYEEAAFCEPLACCINGIMDSRIELGDDVVVIGAGPIGLKHVQLARCLGARVIVSDPLLARLELARRLGAHDTINPVQEDPIARVQELTAGLGAKTVIVAVGDVRAQQQALQMAGINGTVNFFAGTYPPAEFPLNPNLVHYRQLVVTGSHDYTPHDFTTALRLIAFGIVQVAPLISHRLPLTEIREGFELVAGRRGLKVMLLP